MTGLLLDPAALGARTALARGPGAPFAALAASLAADLDLVLLADVHVADEKARLTRAGGRCPVHGTEFQFDPFSPHRFRCRACGRDYAGAEHHQFWLYRYQLWLAERAVHAATLHALHGRPDYAAFAARVLAEAADAYPRLPNRDNVLGPSRPFFSTYLDSLWLLSLCVALDLLEGGGGREHAALGGRVRDQLVEPARALIATYPEGRSNRQVWNAAAQLAAARLLGDALGTERAVRGSGGVAAALGDGLLADGTWYEGDNYHQFAHRGLWYGILMAERAGLAVDRSLAARFDRGFAAPFLVAMPGPTLPARRDAQFAVSLRQWRWAEWLELGVARQRGDGTEAGGGTRRPGGGDESGRFLARWLHTLYAPTGSAARDTGRWRASGEAERNETPDQRYDGAPDLARADLGWKSLLFARAELPYADLGDERAAEWPGPVVLPEQGLAILRAPRGMGHYVSLDYGPPGGGHGHPDRLNVQFPHWVVDPGTGAYVDPTLHWYRSTLAHAAPLVDERSQPPTTGRLLGFDVTADPELQAAAAEAEIAPGVVARRYLVLTRDYLVDHLAWQGLGRRTLDLPVGGELRMARDADRRFYGGSDPERNPDLPWRAVHRPGAGGLEDGFDFLERVEETPLDERGLLVLLSPRELADRYPDAAWVTVHAPPGATLWRALAPGAPGHAPAFFTAVRTTGDAGAITVVWDFTEHMPPSRVAPDGTLDLTPRPGVTHRHRPPGADGRGDWRVRYEQDGAPPREVRLALSAGIARGSAAARPPADARAPAGASAVVALAPNADPLAFDLGRAHYLRSEESWDEAGRPAARVTLAVHDDRLHVAVAVRLGRPTTFVPPGTENPLDNERAAVNGDGVQLHLGVAAPDRVEPLGAWLLVPVPPGDAVDVTRTTAPDPTADAATPAATWALAPGGWTLGAALPLAPLRARAAALGVAPVVAFDVLINEMPPGRERRRGQLLLGGVDPGGGAGTFVYLRGDRHDPARGLRLRLPPAP